MVRDVKPGGTFLINCQWSDADLEHMPAEAKRYIAANNIQVYTLDAIDLAARIGMGKRTNTILQSAFFSLAKVLPQEEAIQYMKDAATHSYLKKGQDVVDMNHKAIDASATAYKKFEVPLPGPPPRMLKKENGHTGPAKLVDMVNKILDPVDRMDGDSLPVSAFEAHVDGTFELGAAAYEKRGVAVSVPAWDATKVHPVQPVLLRLPACHHPSLRSDRGGGQERPEAAKIVDIKGKQGQGRDKFAIAVSPWTAWAAVCAPRSAPRAP